MTTRPWDDERDFSDAPIDLSADGARGWAAGWNAAVREAIRQLDEAFDDAPVGIDFDDTDPYEGVELVVPPTPFPEDGTDAEQLGWYVRTFPPRGTYEPYNTAQAWVWACSEDAKGEAS